MAKYSNDFKTEVVLYFKENGLSATLRKYNISRVSIYRWEHKYDGEGISRKAHERYSLEDKLNILNYYWENGSSATERKFNIASSVFYKWELIYHEEGEKGLEVIKIGRQRNMGETQKKNLSENEKLVAELQYLRMENAALKKLETLVQKRKK